MPLIWPPYIAERWRFARIRSCVSVVVWVAQHGSSSRGGESRSLRNENGGQSSEAIASTLSQLMVCLSTRGVVPVLNLPSFIPKPCSEAESPCATPSPCLPP